MKKTERLVSEGTGIFAVQKTIPAGTIYEIHRHDYIEIELIISGKSEHIYNNEISEASAGHAYIITHHDLHAFRAVEDTEIFSIGFDISLLDKYTSDILSYITNRKLSCIFKGDELNDMISHFKLLIHENRSEKLLSKSLCRALITEIIVNIARRSENISSYSPTTSQKALEYIHYGFKNDLSLGALSEQVGVTPNYLGKIFLHDIGVSFNTYLNRIRLRYACDMLLFSDMPINKIGAISGYSRIEYFYYIFKKEFSVTPKEYRKINGKILNKGAKSAI